VVAAAPEYMEQKATINAVFALAFGLYTYVNPVPTITGAPNLVKLLTRTARRSPAACSAWRRIMSRLSMACWRTSRRSGRIWVSDLYRRSMLRPYRVCAYGAWSRSNSASSTGEEPVLCGFSRSRAHFRGLVATYSLILSSSRSLRMTCS
jgi:hypothetical protein